MKIREIALYTAIYRDGQDRRTQTRKSARGGGGWRTFTRAAVIIAARVERVRRRNTLWSTAFTDIILPISILQTTVLNCYPAESRQEGVRLPRHVNTERINFQPRVYLVALEIPSGQWESRLDFVTAISCLARLSFSSIVEIDFFCSKSSWTRYIYTWRNSYFHLPYNEIIYIYISFSKFLGNYISGNTCSFSSSSILWWFQISWNENGANQKATINNKSSLIRFKRRKKESRKLVEF